MGKSASVEEKQALVCNAVKGFGDLPAIRRAEAVRIAMRAQHVMQQAEGLELAKLAEREHAAAMQRLAALESRSSSGFIDASGSSHAPPVPQRVRSQERLQQSGNPLVENLLRVAKEAKFNEMPRQDLSVIAQAAQREAMTQVQPQHLLDVVTQLNEHEREELTEVLVEAQVVPEEQRGLLEEAVRPGGYADKLSMALGWASLARKYVWVFVALPIVEFALSMVFGLMFECGTPLPSWLQFDSALALFVAGSIFFTGVVLQPVYEKLREDPHGAVHRWHQVSEGRSFRTKLERAVPGVDFEAYRWGAIGVFAIVFLVLVGVFWAVIGVFELLATLVLGCNVATLIMCMLFIGLRFGFLVSMVLLLFFVLDEVQKHRSRLTVLGSTAVPMTEDARPRDRQPPHDHRDFLMGPGTAWE